MELKAVQPDELAARRRAKIDALRVRVFPGEHEKRVGGARCFRIDEGHAEVGYGVFLEAAGPDIQNRLIEFDVSVPWRGRSSAYLNVFIEKLGVEEIEVRTDDSAAFEACLELASTGGWKIAPLTSIYALESGMLRRTPKPEGVAVKRVAKEDTGAAMELVSGEGENTADGFAKAMEAKRLWGLYHEQRLVGAAAVLPEAHHRYVDLRPVIHPDSRRGGLATFLVGEVSHELLNENHRLVTEASPHEWAWRRMAEKVGLTLAAHRILLGSP